MREAKNNYASSDSSPFEFKGEGEKACTHDGDCPEGFVCVDGVCMDSDGLIKTNENQPATESDGLIKTNKE